MTLQNIPFGVRAVILLAASMAAALLVPARLAADELSAILGCVHAGAACNYAALMPGNASAIQQSGSSGKASVEQQAILGLNPNVTSIEQTGDHDTATVTQTGSHNVVGITQHGSGDTATVLQNGSNLVAQVTQWGNGASAIVTQSGGWSTATGKQH